MSSSTLETGIRLVKNVDRYVFGAGSLDETPKLLETRRKSRGGTREERSVVFLIDEFFAERPKILSRLCVESQDRIEFISTASEPETEEIDRLVAGLIEAGYSDPVAIIGMGGGITLDTAKAVSNLMTNGGCAEQYQGWDLVRVPGIHKIGIPTISGTGAEATRTCVMTNARTGLKLGMNSDHTVFDQLILDPELSITVPRDQYFYTGMDAYLHCAESLSGDFRNAVGDAYARETISLCRQVFLNDDMMSEEAREKLMVASYLGGCAIATSYVGLVHPFSAGLSVVLGLHHGIANCITMRAMHEFYPQAYDEFWEMTERQNVHIPTGVTDTLSDDQYRALFEATIVHEKPLANALGSDFRDVLTFDKVLSMFREM